MLRQRRTTARNYKYLIVGGTTKAATTSLFAYLAAHPAICAATYKETRFFLAKTYPLPSKYRYSGNVEEYNLLFPEEDDGDSRIRLESTPDYLYCPNARERIAEFLPHAKLVFSLREPISRLISWYRFAKQNGTLPQTLSFDGYVEMLFEEIRDRGTARDRPSPYGSAGADRGTARDRPSPYGSAGADRGTARDRPSPYGSAEADRGMARDRPSPYDSAGAERVDINGVDGIARPSSYDSAGACPPQSVNARNTPPPATTEQYLQTLQQGCYTVYLRPYFERFGVSRIHILFYEDIAENPRTVLADLCEFAGIDADFYEDYTFQVTNRTETMKNSELHRKYRNFRFQLRQWTHNKPIIHNPLRAVRKAIEPLYLRLNTHPVEQVDVSEETRQRLVDYYQEDVQALAALIGQPAPWHRFCR